MLKLSWTWTSALTRVFHGSPRSPLPPGPEERPGGPDPAQRPLPLPGRRGPGEPDALLLTVSDPPRGRGVPRLPGHHLPPDPRERRRHLPQDRLGRRFDAAVPLPAQGLLQAPGAG